MITLLNGDAATTLATLPSGSTRMCVTSPPYFGLRDYGAEGQIGNEPTLDAYIGNLVTVFDGVRRVLADDGTLWLNLGDSYSGGGGFSPGAPSNATSLAGQRGARTTQYKGRKPAPGFKPKDLIGVPWRVAFALQAAGWYLRSDIVWHKPNPMPESVRDRPTRSHEYIFLLSKSPRYYYDATAILEPFADERQGRDGGTRPSERNRGGRTDGLTKPSGIAPDRAGRNKRDVWLVAPKPFKGAHFAVFPPGLIEPCILAGSAPGDTVLDPFAGSGTSLEVARLHGRSAVGIELSPAYCALARERLGLDTTSSCDEVAS